MRILYAALSISIIFCTAFAQQPDSPAPPPSSLGQPTQVVAASNRDKQWLPTEIQRQSIVSGTYAYFRAKDDGRFADAYASFSAGQKALVAFNPWKRDMEQFYSRAGAAASRTLHKVTWYNDAANSEPGVYAAVDFSSQFPELSLHCGYIVWQQQADGSFAITREEENAIPKSAMSKMTPDMVRNIRAQFRC